jgi:hypothetical protein
VNRKHIKKTWRNPRQITIERVAAEPEDTHRREQLITLLATGLERLLFHDEANTPKSLDFKPEVSNTCITKDETGTEIS